MNKRLSVAMVVLAAACCAAGSELFGQAPGAPAAPPAPAVGPAAPAGAAGAGETASVEMPVKRVVLFSSGVGFFQHEATVDGNASTPLRFDTAQINDVLKSLVVFDQGGGAVRNITYPANNPVAKTLRSFQVDLSGNPPLADILNQIRGTTVEIALGDEVVKGTILGVESKEKAVGKGDDEKVITTWMINVITPIGIRAVALDDVRRVQVGDEKINKEMGQALAALAQARDQSKKVVTVNFEGAGKRHAGLGYLVETPVWKATYRLMLPDEGSKDLAKLQGWAIVENQTDNDWKNVELSLVGGRPLGFIELLYQPLYNPRPVVQPKLAEAVHPQTYDDGMQGGAAAGAAEGNVKPPTFDLSSITKGGTTSGGGQGSLFSDTTQRQNFVSNFDTKTDYSQGVISIAQTAKIGEMFHYNVDKVTLPRQQSSMIPIIAESVDCQRVSIYNQQVLQQRALRGVRLKNVTGKYMLGGPLTVFDTVKEGTSYAGDATVDDVPPGQSRLLSYAVDQDLLVDVSTDQSASGLIGGSIAKGVLRLRHLDRQVTDYTVQNKSSVARTVIVEHPIVAGYELKEPAKFEEKTDSLYRFQFELPKGAAKLRVVAEQTTMQEVAILTISDNDITIYLHQGVLSDKVKAMLQTVAAKRAAAADLARRITKKQQDRSRILEDEANVRENIRVLPSGSKSQQDAIADLSARDAELKAATKDLQDLQQQGEAARADLDNYVADTVAE